MYTHEADKLRVIFDAGPLITSSKFKLDGRPVIDFILESCEIIISSTVMRETVIEGFGYPDSLIIKQRIDQSKIIVRDIKPIKNAVLRMYKLNEGEIESILLYQELQDKVDFLVVDDSLAYIVSDRLGLNKTFLLDLILRLVRKGRINEGVAEKIIEVVRPRYSEGFIEHSLEMLREEARDDYTEC